MIKGIAYFIIISQLGDSNEHQKHKFKKYRLICVLVIINIHTFSGLWISCAFIMFIYMKYTLFCMQNIVIEKLFIIKVT